MNQKAKSLTDIVNLFKPMALTEEQSVFYQKTASVRDGTHYEFHEGFYNRILKSDSHERLLVVGHGGCGKSTELHMLKAKLAKFGLPVIHIEARDDLDLYNFSYIDLFMLIVDRTAQYAVAHKLKIDKRIVSAFEQALSSKVRQDFWSEEKAVGVEGSVSLSASIPSFVKALAKISSALKMASGYNEQLRLEIKPRIPDIVSSLNALFKELSEQVGHPIVIIIDGLEKCRQECVRKLFIEDISSLSDINAHLVIACPISVFRSSDASVVSSYFVSPVVIPMIKTHNVDGSNNTAGIAVIRELILKRADDSFFDAEVLDKIITSAGGSLRDTCNILSNCAFEASMHGNETIDMNSVCFTLNRYATDVFFRVENRLYQRVKKIYDKDFKATQDPELSELLYSGAVFEYNGDRWVDLHPLIRKYIDDHSGVLD